MSRILAKQKQRPTCASRRRRRRISRASMPCPSPKVSRTRSTHTHGHTTNPCRDRQERDTPKASGPYARWPRPSLGIARANSSEGCEAEKSQTATVESLFHQS
ncbi:hypothetical protein FVEG_15214 [Fusarium verticillioides 7600]|uniref:Uncharacterized protein n=1 Tax=Gibberella moniliformis (strain M3125 / FGSC 7600) TaxID=334819 RepID=W7LNQ6_GIBM7|nr:hypothetical protein FVEG_15214 [Fusarium verticillioides 7600]EWG41023.1 hypothetical protein FVEG_15214 [Fusarium verticillioides 7600]